MNNIITWFEFYAYVYQNNINNRIIIDNTKNSINELFHKYWFNNNSFVKRMKLLKKENTIKWNRDSKKNSINYILKKWKIVKRLKCHFGCINAIEFHFSNRIFYSASDDRTIKIWSFPDIKLKSTLTGHIEKITDLASSTRESIMFSASLDKSIKSWDVGNLRLSKHFIGHLSGVYLIRYNDMFKLLYSGGRDNTCRIWDCLTAKEIHCLSGHYKPITGLAGNFQNQFVFTGSEDGVIKIWDSKEGECIRTLDFGGTRIKYLNSQEKNNEIISGTSSSIYRIYIKEEIRVIKKITSNKYNFECFTTSNNGIIAVADNIGRVHFWNSFNLMYKGNFIDPVISKNRLRRSVLISLKFDLSNRFLLSGDNKNDIIVWEKKN